MSCPQCGHPNPADAKFCSDCGAALEPRCPRCGRGSARESRYGDEIQRTHGVPIQIRVGINSGDVVVRSIGSDLHMDYTAVGQTTHLAARMEQMAKPGSSLLAPPTLRLVEGYVRVRSFGPV